MWVYSAERGKVADNVVWCRRGEPRVGGTRLLLLPAFEEAWSFSARRVRDLRRHYGRRGAVLQPLRGAQRGGPRYRRGARSVLRRHVLYPHARRGGIPS